MNRILNFGSLNIDYVYSVEHFVKPCETISSKRLDVFPGGKGLNQSIALAKAGSFVFHAGAIGKDGQWLKDTLTSANVNTTLVDTVESVTGHDIIQVDENGQNCILLHGGANQEIKDAFVLQALESFGHGDLLVLQNEINNNELIMKTALAKGLTIALNPSPMDKSILSLPLEMVTWLIMNEVEGQALTNETHPEKICDELLKKYPELRIVLTLGSQGVLYRDRTQRHSNGVYDVPVVDTTAAGDTFTGYFLSSITKNIAIPEALRLASIAAAIAVSQNGASVSIPTFEQVQRNPYQLLMP